MASGARPAPRPTAKPTYEQIRAHVLGNFRGEIPPVETSLSYKLGILAVAGVMVLLPMAYIGLIALTCFAVYYHAVYHVGMLSANVRGRGIVLVFLAYIAPLAIGAILIAFMLKPLFARPGRESRKRSLSRDGEPLLFEFVDRICAAVHAPLPRRIDVDSQVNASAGFRRGWLSLLGSDLVLTIGMPLVAGLNMKQFAGVLAHEFGHFSQGAGMRLTYVIRSIVYWFHRVVNERDEWDEWLAQTSGEVDLRIGWVLYLARFFVWLTRRVLYLLMMLGHAVSGIMLRQMEFDADRYEARMAGSDTFETTARRLAVLNVANSGAQADLGSFFSEGRLGDDLPKLIMANVEQIPANIQRKIQESVDQSETGWFDTHPADRERIISAAQEQAPGIFRIDLPATMLFRDFSDVSKKVTWDYFSEIFGSQLRPDQLHSVDDLIARQKTDFESRKALGRFFQGEFSLGRTITIPDVPQITEQQAGRAIEVVRQARDSIVAMIPQHKQPRKDRMESIQRLVEAEQVLSLNRAGLKPRAADFRVPTELVAALRMRNQLDVQVKQLDEQLGVLDQWCIRRMVADLALLGNPEFAQRIPNSAQLAHHAAALLPTTRLLLSLLPERQNLQVKHAVLAVLLGQIEGNQEDSHFINSVIGQSREVKEAANALRAKCKDVLYPFDHAKAGMTIDRFLLTDPLLDETAVGSVYEGAESVIDGLGTLAVRCLSQILWVAEQVELAIGLPPLADPPDEDPE